MKVLGFVNRYSRGAQTVQEELRTNGNGEAEFKLHLGTAFLVIEMLSSNSSKKEEKKELKKQLEEVLRLIRRNPHIIYNDLMNELKISQTPLYTRIKKLEDLGIIRLGGRYGGKWTVID